MSIGRMVVVWVVWWASFAGDAAEPLTPRADLPKVRVVAKPARFETSDGKPYVPIGVNYYRPGTGWAPQLWKKFDAGGDARRTSPV